VKDDFSIHVLKDVAISSAIFAQNLQVLWGVVDHSTTPTRAATLHENPRPAESAAVCGGKLQSKGLGFGADCRRPLGFTHSSRTETYGTRGGD
jgi:hypothetical protein